MLVITSLVYVALMVTGAIAAPGVASHDAKSSLPRPIGGHWDTSNPMVGGIGGGLHHAGGSDGPMINGGQPAANNPHEYLKRRDGCKTNEDCREGWHCAGRESDGYGECTSPAKNPYLQVIKIPHLPGKPSRRDLDEFRGECNSHEECGTGSFCVSHWCTVARKLEDGSMNLAARDVVAEDEDYWYLEARSAVEVLDKLSGRNEKLKPRNKCPKKCGEGKRCCSQFFCQPPNCLGDFDD